jgi:hypothetical protein
MSAVKFTSNEFDEESLLLGLDHTKVRKVQSANLEVLELFKS